MLLTESATLHLFESSSYCYESVRVFYCCSASVYNNNQKSCAYFVVEVLEVTESIGIEVYQVRLFVTQRLERLRTFLVLVHREVRATTLQRQTNAGCRPKPGNSDHRSSKMSVFGSSGDQNDLRTVSRRFRTVF